MINSKSLKMTNNKNKKLYIEREKETKQIFTYKFVGTLLVRAAAIRFDTENEWVSYVKVVDGYVIYVDDQQQSERWLHAILHFVSKIKKKINK